MTGPSLPDWDADTYHAVSAPQVSWGQGILARVPVSGRERVLDAGCGSGRLTELLARRVTAGRVIGLDRSPDMLRVARAHLSGQANVALVRADLLALPLAEAVDMIFSAATFHWVLDHDRLFAGLLRALMPGGLLVAQFGGQGNLQRVLARASAVMASPPFEPFFRRWTDPWTFPDDRTTAARLERLGFEDVTTELVPAPTSLPDRQAYSRFLATVVMRPHLGRLPDTWLQTRFLDALADEATADRPPFTLDYRRLNLMASRPVRVGT